MSNLPEVQSDVEKVSIENGDDVSIYICNICNSRNFILLNSVKKLNKKDGKTYHIVTSDGFLKCSRCGQEGHISSLVKSNEENKVEGEKQLADNGKQ